MIIVIDSLNRCDFTDLVDEVFALRGRVFRDRLGWDVEVDEKGHEHDIFDKLDPAYVVSLDDDGHAVGCMRLLQTTGPHMMSDVFAELLDGEPALRSPLVWEATRFCVDTQKLNTGRGRNSVSFVTSEVMIGSFEYAMQAGVTDAVAVIDPIMNRLMKRSNNAPYDYLGRAKPMGKVTAMAALMDCSSERIAGIREFSGIDYDVFLSEEQARALIGTPLNANVQAPTKPATPKPSRVDALASYCRDQLAAARTDDERHAAFGLLETIASTISADDWQRVCAQIPSAVR